MGTGPGQVSGRSARKVVAGKTISLCQIDPVPVFHKEFEFLPVPVRLACEFPHPGRYLIQVWFLQEETADVIKAEQPFDVLEEA